MSILFNKLKFITIFGLVTAAISFAEECDEKTMDAFAYEDCIAAQNGVNVDNTDFSKRPAAGKEAAAPEAPKYSPFGKTAYLTSSFGENRGTRYHMGIDYSTDMEEGWAVYAPENGYVKEVKVSPYGYGKVMYYKGNSGKTWVFAHQSSFGPHLDSLVMKKMISSKKNDVSLTPNTVHKKGDTLTFAGSTGIGNPHLHLELKMNDNKVLSPCGHDVLCADSIAPQVFAAAALYKNDVTFTSKEALEMGCVETPIQNTFENDVPVQVAFKIVDYSRLPKENPMAVRRVDLYRYDEKVFSKVQDTISFPNSIKIRDELLWAEEADTLGDWHFIKVGLPPQSTYRLEVEDFNGNITTKKFNLKPNCKGNVPFAKTHYQETPLFTYLSRAMIDFSKCDAGFDFEAYDKDDNLLSGTLCKMFPKKYATVAKIGEIFPSVSYIKFKNASEEDKIYIHYQANKVSNINWKAQVDGMEILQRLSGVTNISNNGNTALAFVKHHTDSLDYFEFHPKGMQFFGKWDICIDENTAKGPLYWLGETSRNWFIFSKQTKGKNRCASANELRDIAAIDNPNPPTLGFAYWGTTIFGGLHAPALKIPLIYKYAGIENGNAITAKYKNRWIPVEYDSEPRELIILGEQLPEDNETITIQIVDEAGHKATYDVTIPEL
ncbi:MULTISPECIES: M23 family metallopeptidase [unclassified Fibrobacter]|uniref:M23 family metallopeptidase n=1 Tax=unclassified Fibrobacter TaxID=2634177 RepID=UPI000D6BF8F2|nr:MULTISPECIES: M23 family metallopeptidase [unclassified Fibrobacter]PWJ68252.1 peptidase M23-like protein [Fibrobacter sp. UWR4]PZW72610.1 peptidase M23-like protein [Fibrobacter sp. UWR1]